MAAKKCKQVRVKLELTVVVKTLQKEPLEPADSRRISQDVSDAIESEFESLTLVVDQNGETESLFKKCRVLSAELK